MSAFAAAAAALFADSNLAVEASLQAMPGGTATTLRAILTRPVAVAPGLGGTVAAQVEASILVSALTAPPKRGDRLTVGATSYRVERAERDGAETSWRLMLATS